MTNEEAIEILRKNKPTADPRLCGKELCEAVDLGIIALKKTTMKRPVIILQGNDITIRCPSCGKELLYVACARGWAKTYPFRYPNVCLSIISCPACECLLDWSEG